MSSIEILITNASLYTLTLLTYLYIVRRFNLGVMLLSIYAFGAWSSVFFYKHELFELSIHDSVMTWEPFIYLFIVLIIFFFPVLNFRSEKITEIEMPDLKKINAVAYFVIFTSIICIISYFPHMLNGMQGDISENRDTVMTEGLKVDFNPIISVLVRVGISLRDIVILLFFYVLAYMKERKILLVILGVCAFVTPMVCSLAWSARTIIIFLLFSVLTCYLLFYNILSNRIKITINCIFATIFGFLFFIFFIISISRFGEDDMFGIDFFMLKYMGENFVNFNGILYDQTIDILYGGNSFPLFRRFLGLDYWTTISEFRSFAGDVVGVPVYIFYLFVGSFYLDFGPQVTVMIAVLMCFIGYKVFKSNSTVSFHQLILFILFYNIFTEGFFYFSLYDEPGNLKILMHIFLFFYFKLNIKNIDTKTGLKCNQN